MMNRARTWSAPEALPDRAEVVVIGLGGMGAATVEALAQRGCEVVGLDAQTPPHNLGSSHGGSRVARMAYFEHPDYVPLLRRAFEGWRRLDVLAGQPALVPCGVLLCGRADSQMLRASAHSAALHGVPVESLDPAALAARCPALSLPGDMGGLLEPEAGFVRPEVAIDALLAQAAAHGARLFAQTPVAALERAPGGVSVKLRSGRSVEARRVVLTAGAWTSKLAPTLADAIRLTPQRQWMVWLDPQDPRPFEADRLPAFLIDDGGRFGEGCYYGVPIWREGGLDSVKIGFHGPAPEVEPDEPPASSAQIETRFRDELATWMPGLAGAKTRSASCLYTMTPDQHFVLDRLPTWPEVIVGAGFSGHGFKFVPAIGEQLTKLALDGAVDPEARFLGLTSRTR